MKLSMKEAVDIAIGIEDSGCHFYSSCRTRFQDGSFRELFGFLAQEELRHKELFENLLSPPDAAQDYFTEERSRYLRAIADSRIFKNRAHVGMPLSKGWIRSVTCSASRSPRKRTPSSGIPSSSPCTGHPRTRTRSWPGSSTKSAGTSSRCLMSRKKWGFPVSKTAASLNRALLPRGARALEAAPSAGG